MVVSVDIGRIHDHLPILQAELREAEALAEYLTAWHEQTSVDGLMDMRFIEKHLQIVCNQIGYIRQRIMLLETMMDNFSDLIRTTAELLADTKDSANASAF